MSEYTPTTEEVRERWMNFDGGPDATDAAEFDRWLALIIEGAEQRGAAKAGRAMLEQAIRDMDPEFGSEM